MIARVKQSVAQIVKIQKIMPPESGATHKTLIHREIQGETEKMIR
jgi:hypothetical protein